MYDERNDDDESQLSNIDKTIRINTNKIKSILTSNPIVNTFSILFCFIITLLFIAHLESFHRCGSERHYGVLRASHIISKLASVENKTKYRVARCKVVK